MESQPQNPELMNIGPVKQIFLAYHCHYFLTHQFKICFGSSKHCLIEAVLLSTHNIMFWLRNEKVIFNYALLSGSVMD